MNPIRTLRARAVRRREARAAAELAAEQARREVWMQFWALMHQATKDRA